MKLKFPHLGQRWLTALGGGIPLARSDDAAREAHSDRLREVLGRDRALAVGSRVHARSAPPGQSAQPRPLAPVSPPAELIASHPDLRSAQPEAGAPISSVEARAHARERNMEPPLASAIDPAASADRAPAAGGAQEPDEAPGASGAQEPLAAARRVPAAAELAAAATAEERPQRVQHEPIRTRTMARLLAAQGYRQRALAIYDELLARPGADDGLRAEAGALRVRSA